MEETYLYEPFQEPFAHLQTLFGWHRFNETADKCDSQSLAIPPVRVRANRVPTSPFVDESIGTD